MYVLYVPGMHIYLLIYSCCMSCMSYIHVPWYVCHVMYVCHVCTYMMYEGTNGCCTT